MTYKNNLLTLVAAGLLTLLPTACTDDLNGTGGTQGEGYGVPVQGISFFEAEPFAEDTIAAHQPTMETNVEDAPDMDVMAYETINVQTETSARRAAEANGGIMRHTLDEMQNAPTLAKALKRSQQARAKARRAAGNTPQEDHIVAGRKPLVPVRHKATADDSEQTRSFDVDEESAIFVMNDSVGVYELDAFGNIVKANVKFVYNAGLWNCEAPLEYQAGHRYFAYHPYRTNEQLAAMDMTVDRTVGKKDSAYVDFFKTFWENWPVSDDQGEYKKYHACDLLAGEATWNAETATLGFPMHHLMGMLQLEFGVARIYLDWADEENYPYWWTDTVTTNLKNMTLLPKFVGKYRRITRPDTELTVVAADSAWTLHFDAEKSISRGHYQHYDIGKTRSNDTEFYQIFYNQLGDILLQDGRLMHRHDWRRIQPNRPVGIVVGTVYPAVNPYDKTIVGPLETNPDGTLYNCHSLERDFIYEMKVVSITEYADSTVINLKPQFVRCLVMSLKDVSYGTSSDISFDANWAAAWSWNDAIAHFPNTHVPEVSAPMYNVEPLMYRYRNYWYPDMGNSWAAKAACYDFNRPFPNGSGVEKGDSSRQYTPHSGWFIGTCGQYQMAFCFGRERAFGDSWKQAAPLNTGTQLLIESADFDGAKPVWQYEDGIPCYNAQYSPVLQINTWQNSETYTDNLSYTITYPRKYTRSDCWGPEYGDVIPTAWHDFDRINNAMQYALGSSSSYDKIEGGTGGKAYTTSTLRCDLGSREVFFPQTISNWDYKKKYYTYKDWTQLVTFQLSNNTYKMSRGKAYYLSWKYADDKGIIRPLMAL